MDKVSPDKGKTELITKLYLGFKTSLVFPKAERPRDFLKDKGLDFTKIDVGFNSGQFHHRKDDAFKAPYVEIGILTKSDAPVREPGMIGYSTFGDYGLIFPLKDKLGDIVSLYAHRIKLQVPKGEYLNEEGIYPGFPSKRTTRLFLTQTVIDAATLLQSDILENRDAVIALRDGELTTEIKGAMEQLDELTQIIVFGAKKDKVMVKTLEQLTSARVSYVQVPEESLNDFWLSYCSEGVLKLIEEERQNSVSSLVKISDREFQFKGQEVTYHINGIISQNITLMEFDFEIVANKGGTVFFQKLDLLNDVQIQKQLYYWTGNMEVNMSQMLLELKQIKTELDQLRQIEKKSDRQRGYSVKQDKLAKQLLRSKDLFSELDKLIRKTGVVGEEKSRLLLYLIASSYKFSYNLHAVIHAEDMTTGSELASTIASLIPQTERYEIDITSSRTFRYYGNSAIDNKLIVIPDYSGVTASRAIGDLKRLQAKGSIVNDSPVKGADGILSTVKQEVLGHCSSIGACSKSKRYFEGQPRTVLVAMDNSTEQMQRLMDHDCLRLSGKIDAQEIEKSRELLQYVIRNLAPLEVINPHAAALMLPTKIRNARMLTLQLNCFVSLVALFRQHQKEADKLGRIEVSIEDIQTGLDLYLDALMVTIDELDAGTREFFDKLKLLMLDRTEKKKSKLSSMDIQRALGLSKSHVNRFLSALLEQEYVKKEGHRNQGFNYSVTNWDESASIRQMILSKLVTHRDPNAMGHQNTDKH